jgi:hypothetical protein
MLKRWVFQGVSTDGKGTASAPASAGTTFRSHPEGLSAYFGEVFSAHVWSWRGVIETTL